MISILRPINLLLLFAVQFTLWFRLCVPNLLDTKLIEFILISISVIFTAAAAYIINDIVDRETDKINKPKKVFIENKISKKKAYLLFILLNVLAISAALLVFNLFIIIITVFSILMLYIYSLKLKQSIFWGNLTVALMSVLPIIEIYLFNMPLTVETEFIAYAVFAFLTSLLREIVKDKEDSAGDIETGIKTLANSISDKRLTMILSIINSVLIVSLFCFLFLLKIQTITGFLFYLLFMILPGILLFFQFFRSKTKASYTSISLYLKIYMFLGLIRLWI